MLLTPTTPISNLSNDFFGFPTTLILGKRCLGWRTWILLILKRHLFYCKFKNWHHSNMYTHFWWVGFVIRSGKWTSKILDIGDKDQTTSPCCPCNQPATPWAWLPLLLLSPSLLLGHYCILEESFQDQNWVSCWWGGFLIPSCHIPLCCPGGPASNSQLPSLACGLADSKIDEFTGLQRASQSSGPLENISLTPPFPFSVIECQENRWRVGRMNSRLSFSK